MVVKQNVLYLQYNNTTTGRFPRTVKKINIMKVTTMSGSEHEIKTDYFVDFVYTQPSGENFYHQLTRSKDGLILYANADLNNIFIWCWQNDIAKKNVTIL